MNPDGKSGNQGNASFLKNSSRRQEAKKLSITIGDGTNPIKTT